MVCNLCWAVQAFRRAYKDHLAELRANQLEAEAVGEFVGLIENASMAALKVSTEGVMRYDLGG